eukprot:Awhi_evm1s5800
MNLDETRKAQKNLNKVVLWIANYHDHSIAKSIPFAAYDYGNKEIREAISQMYDFLNTTMGKDESVVRLGYLLNFQ